jgi:Tfp pilus assembly protein PilV
MEHPGRHKGQSLIEVLVGIGLAAVFVIGAVSIIAPALKINTQTSQIQTYAQVLGEFSTNINAWASQNWNSVLNLTTSTAYYLNTSSSPFTATVGSDQVILGGNTYARSFYLSDIYRDSNGNVTTTAGGNSYDPSTKQVAVAINGPVLAGGIQTTSSTYPSRQTPDSGPGRCWVAMTNVNGYVYGLGGGWTGVCGNPATTTVYYAKANGSIIGTWTKTTSVPAGIDTSYGNTFVTAYNGYIYITVGSVETSETSTIYYAKPNSDGSISSWNYAGSTPLPVTYSVLMTTNGYFYAVGGTFQNNNVYFTKINSDGTLGPSWTTSNLNPIGWTDTVGAAYNGYLYMPDETNAPLGPAIYYTGTSATGTPLLWKTTTSLPVTAFVVLQAYGGYLYAFPADTGAQDQAWYAPIHSDGTVGTWTSVSLPSSGGGGYSNVNFTISNGTLYFLGVGATAIVYAAPSTQLASSTFLITRNQNSAVNQTSWAGGSGSNNPVTVISTSYATSSNITVSGGALQLSVPVGGVCQS